MPDAPQPESARRACLIHIAAWAVVNAGLAAWNLAQTPAAGQPREYWFQWPLIGWGIGVAAHGLALWLERLGRKGGLLAEREVRGAAVHLFVYLAVNALLIAVNLVATPDTIWFFWPLIGWGVGLAVHAWLVYRAVLRKTLEHYALEQRLIGEIAEERRAKQEAAAAAAPDQPRTPGAAPPKRARAPAKKRAAAKGKAGAAKKTASASRKKPPAKKPAAARKAASEKPAARKPAPQSRTGGRGRKAG